MFGLAFLLMFIIAAGTLAWRVIVTKSRDRLLKTGGAAAVMTTMVGAFVVFDDITDFHFADWRSDLGLLAASSASFYLLLWSTRHRTNRRHRTFSIAAAMIGFVPVVGAAASALFLRAL